METSQLKTYGPRARRDFIEAVKNRAAVYGLLPKETLLMKEAGDVVIIGDRPFPRAVAKQRKQLEDRIKQQGFQPFVEAVAYTWFNRLVAIRYMELHGYLDHGYRVLSHPEGKPVPEILENAERVELPGLNRDKVIELKLDGAKDEELYRLLLRAQCNALHAAMPFLFEAIGDETELLLPDNLLHTDSLVRTLVGDIPEELWQEIEIIGWLYQFYISEKKDQVIGKVVKSEDIPAATQLFTPNWIVKYMVQNSLGAQWLATYPDSPLKGQMEFYIEPAEQTDEVNAQLKAITPDSLDPEKLTLIDPACGSGHILVEAYELFKAIYLERGYRQRDVPKLILEKNLFGLDIDVRAAQLSGFALMMKGRADDRQLFDRGVTLNVMALVNSDGFDAEALAKGVDLGEYGLTPGDLTELKRLFEHATTFGSLIQVPERLAEKLPGMQKLCDTPSENLFVTELVKHLGPQVRQAQLLAAQYDAVVANPPYMGNKYQTPTLKKYLKDCYKGYEKDFFSAFIDRNLSFSQPHGRLGFMSPFVWMFLSSHQSLRDRLVGEESITSLIQLEYSGFEGATVPICTFTLRKGHLNGKKGSYIQLADFRGSENQGPKTLEAIRNRHCSWFFEACQDQFGRIPGSPVAYWVSDSLRDVFDGPNVGQFGRALTGLQTGNTELFLRLWHEVSQGAVAYGCPGRTAAIQSKMKWFPCNKGGAFRKWFGNLEYLVNWGADGEEIKAAKARGLASGKITANNSQCWNQEKYFQPGLGWSLITSGQLSVRKFEQGVLFEITGPTLFVEPGSDASHFLQLLNSKLGTYMGRLLAPTLSFSPGVVEKFPALLNGTLSSDTADRLVEAGRADWNAYERSWDFHSLPLLTVSSGPTPTIESSYTAWITQNRDAIVEMKRLEEENNRLFIDAYSLADELTPDVPIEQITLTVNPAYRYGGNLTEEEQWTRFREDTMEELVSYAIGCTMGRYSLDEPGLIYAHRGGEGFDASRYKKFTADDDGIVPLTDTDWFEDDACHRVVEFLGVAWNKSHLEENMKFLAANLSPKRGETSRETLRRYLCDSFFKDHLQTYKRRPIYWLFSSGKQKAFQCLVYLHRYNEGTLARMRTKYVVPLQGKFNARIDLLESDIASASSTSHRKALEKKRDKLIKQRTELQAFDEKLRHHADQRITLDLDDGVKVNYGKFGDLLAEVKAVTGDKAEASV